jgi:hypothetical protein
MTTTFCLFFQDLSIFFKYVSVKRGKCTVQYSIIYYIARHHGVNKYKVYRCARYSEIKVSELTSCICLYVFVCVPGMFFFILHMHICVWVKRRGVFREVCQDVVYGVLRCVCGCVWGLCLYVYVCVFALRSHLHQATVISALTLKAGRKLRMSLLCGGGGGGTTCEHFNRHPKIG